MTVPGGDSRTVTHFAIHQPTPDLTLWRTACGIGLANAAHWVTVTDGVSRVTCGNCLRSGWLRG